MTIAVDIKTGAVVGQLADVRQTLTPDTECEYVLLTGEGYVSVPAFSVRLETLR